MLEIVNNTIQLQALNLIFFGMLMSFIEARGTMIGIMKRSWVANTMIAIGMVLYFICTV